MLNLKKILLLIIIPINIFVAEKVLSQNISFMNDYLNNILVFDNGKIKQIEHKPLKSYQIGNNAIAYEDNAGNFKIYYNHYVHNVSINIDSYQVSNNLIAFRYKNILKLFDNGKIHLLSLSSSVYYVGDNIVVWYDEPDKKLKAYYNSNYYDLDDALATDVANAIYGANNIVGYIDSRNYFNIFYDEKIIPIDHSERISKIQAGKDLVAFVDESANSFQIFYYGELTEVENFSPVSYKTGDAFIAYIDANGYFKVFKDFNVETIAFNTPNFYEIKNDIMVFGVQNYFKAYINSKVYTLENFIPEKYVINNNVVAYIDQQGYLKYFDGEKKETVSYEKIKEFELNGNLLKYKYGISSETIYFNGKKYNN